MTDIDRLRYKLLGSFLEFTKYFYHARTNKEFKLSFPISRESHFISLSKMFTKIFNGELTHVVSAIPPRHGKTEMCIHFIAWCLAHHPDSNFLYVSYNKSLATKQTSIIKQIVSHPHYQLLFNVHLSDSTHAKDNFETLHGGSVYAVGAGGDVTGRGAGIQGSLTCGGGIIIDDIIKPIEATSDLCRQRIKDWYFNTLISRVNDPNTFILCNGQRTHEDDLAGNLLKGFDGRTWHPFILKALDENDHPIYPEYQSLEDLKRLEKFAPYEFASQYQQHPVPAGGGIFKKSWFVELENNPQYLSTFITCDTAETSKHYNDATVLSLWGVYEINEEESLSTNTRNLGLHWIDCVELRVEPKDLLPEFTKFYTEAQAINPPPTLAAIEKAATGTTLYSLLTDKRGLRLHPLIPAAYGLSKGARFLKCQPIVAEKRISFTSGVKHAPNCIEHMSRITINDSHRFDDIADTCAFAIQLVFFDKVINVDSHGPNKGKSKFAKLEQIRLHNTSGRGVI